MAQYLSPEQRRQFENALNGSDDSLTPEQTREALRQGEDMAKADAETLSPEAELLRKNGFDSLEELLEAYRTAQKERADAEDLLRALLDVRKARDTEARLAARRPADDPDAEQTLNRAIRHEWRVDAEDMPDLLRFLPDMADYIMEHPEYAMDDRGLRRAYEAVRARMYRSEDELLADPETVARLAGDDRVRQAVLTAHMSGILKSGRRLPRFIDDGGSAIGSAPSDRHGMDRAHARLTALLTRDI